MQATSIDAMHNVQDSSHSDNSIIILCIPLSFSLHSRSLMSCIAYAVSITWSTLSNPRFVPHQELVAAKCAIFSTVAEPPLPRMPLLLGHSLWLRRCETLEDWRRLLSRCCVLPHASRCVYGKSGMLDHCLDLLVVPERLDPICSELRVRYTSKPDVCLLDVRRSIIVNPELARTLVVMAQKDDC